MRAFKLLSATRIAAVEERLHSSAKAWCNEWGLVDAPLSVRSQTAEYEKFQAGCRWFGVEGQGSALGLYDDSFENLFSLIAAEQAPSVLPPVLRRWLEDAVGRLVELIIGEPLNATGLPGPDETLLLCGSGAVFTEIRLADVVLHVLLCDADVDRLAPLKSGATPRGGLSKRGLLVGNAAVGLKATLTGASIEVGELSSLRVGDTLRLDHLIGEPAFVYSQTGTELGRAHLGLRHACRALSLSNSVELKAKYV